MWRQCTYNMHFMCIFPPTPTLRGGGGGIKYAYNMNIMNIVPSYPYPYIYMMVDMGGTMHMRYEGGFRGENI